MRRLRKILKWLLILLVLCGLAGGAVWFFRPDLIRRFLPRGEKTKQDEKSDPDRIYTVRRGSMTLGVLLKGTVNAKQKHKLALEAPFGTKLVRVVDENTRVKTGDIVAEFETSDLNLKIEDLRMNVEQTKKDLSIAREEREMLVSTNAAALRTAHDNVTAAEDAYSRYIQLEGPKERDTKDLSVSDAEQARDTAEAELTTLRTDYDTTVFASADDEKAAKNKIESSEQKLSAAETKVESAMMDRKLFKRYTNPNKIRELRNKLAQVRLEYEKTRVQTQSQLAQKDNQITRYELSLRNNELQLKLHESWVPMMKLAAPADGIITYGDPDAPAWRKPEVKVGMDGRRNQVILTIPDMTQLSVDVALPEQYRSRVAVGNRAVITPDSIREIKLSGEVVRIASLPEKLIFWDEGSPKIYRTVIDFRDSNPKIVSGMSVQVEIISRVLPNVLAVPVEAVFEEGGSLFVYRKSAGSPEKVPVRIGNSSDNSVEVVEGVQEDDEIYLYRPFQQTKK